MNTSTTSTQKLQKQNPVINTIPYSSPVKSIHDKKLSISQVSGHSSQTSSRNLRLTKVEQISPSNTQDSFTIKDNSIQIDQDKYTKVLEKQIAKYKELLDKEIKEHEFTKSEFQQLKTKYDHMKAQNQLAAEKLINENNEKQQQNLNYWKGQAKIFNEKYLLLEQFMQQTQDITPHKINKQTSLENNDIQSQSFLKDLSTFNNQLNQKSQQDLFDQLQMKQQQTEHSYLKTNLNKNPSFLLQKNQNIVSQFQNNDGIIEGQQIVLQSNQNSQQNLHNLDNIDKNIFNNTINQKPQQLQNQDQLNFTKPQKQLEKPQQPQFPRIRPSNLLIDNQKENQSQAQNTFKVQNQEKSEQKQKSIQKSFMTINQTRDFQEDVNFENPINLKYYAQINLANNQNSSVDHQNDQNQNQNNNKRVHIQIPQIV